MDVSRTITNAVLREAGAGGFVPGSGVAIDVGDVEITETEARSQAAVVLLSIRRSPWKWRGAGRR